MPQHIGYVAVLIEDYDEAIAFYTEKLGFALIEDTDQGNGKRWVLMAPRGDGGTQILLAKARGAKQNAAVGNQTGGRVFLFLHTDDFDRDHAAMLAAGVTFLEARRVEIYGKVAVFVDLYGNKWDLLEPVSSAGS